ncbi:TetR/AcrR family transcriptional regulator [Actinocrispum wychmicini]|uniref:TetR family transcriptional regulator n=1 Tax=Actinocrispum wychmicini TaxID=1213861 RepID=A0A4R2IZJ8_9PSEU|nr:TetR/AcrR family transcriptional regulator [Actinocrispum wychmicini]TCO50787.1 TetR family transcriptional regulator [Actinocrispum wychmicini]
MADYQQVRRRDANASRAALLEAAAELFAERGYDRTTVRDIAGRAGVNQALLFRYFGSKEALFAAVVARAGRDKLAEAPGDRVYAHILRAILDEEQKDRKNHSLQIMLRSSAEDVAVKTIRQELGQDYIRAIGELTDAQDADIRAHLALAWIVGIDMLRTVGGAEPLASADPEDIVKYVLPAVRTLLERAQDV